MAKDHFEEHRSMLQSAWWNFNVLFDNQPAVHEMARSYVPALEHLGLYPPIPSKWLHSTVLAVGPVADYSEQEMMAVVKLLKPKLSVLKLPGFKFDSWLNLGGVVLHISPENQFTKIYDCVIEAMEGVVGPDRTRRSSHDKFIAHMTLAYANEHFDEPAVEKMYANQPVQPIAFTDLNLALIKQFSKDGHYEWAVVKELPIGRE